MQKRRREKRFRMYTLDRNAVLFQPTDGQRELFIIRCGRFQAEENESPV